MAEHNPVRTASWLTESAKAVGADQSPNVYSQLIRPTRQSTSWCREVVVSVSSPFFGQRLECCCEPENQAQIARLRGPRRGPAERALVARRRTSGAPPRVMKRRQPSKRSTDRRRQSIGWPSTAAALVANKPMAVELTEVSSSAGVELLRYPVPLERQSPGQTMAIGALAVSLRRYGFDTLVTALRCFTRSSNNRSEALTARMIKAVGEVLHRNPSWVASDIQLFAAADKVHFGDIEKRALAQAAREGVGRLKAVADEIEREIAARLRRQAAA